MSDQSYLRDHKEWLGYLQPVGLVVSPPALVRLQAIVQRNVAPQQTILRSNLHTPEEGLSLSERPHIRDFATLTQTLLHWRPEDLIHIDQEDSFREQLQVYLPEYNHTLSPTYAVPHDVEEDILNDPHTPNDEKWMMLIQEHTIGTDFDALPPARSTKGWHVPPQAQFERLLRETGLSLGLMYNATDIRLVYAPRGENAGHITFPIDAMTEVSGRLILSAFCMLLSESRIFATNEERSLLALLRESRKYQAEVSNLLSEQVLQALLELLRGFQTAHELQKGQWFITTTEEDRQHIYGGLLTTLLRLVFLLYAEDRGLMPTHSVYVNYYSVSGLFDRLREDMGRHPDTMDRRYGAWAQLLSLFRLVYHGGGLVAQDQAKQEMRLPPRHGQLFDPDTYPFLEGRIGTSVKGERLIPPRISDGVLYRILDKLLVVGGERLSYRALDVENIGSVYESMMGYTIELATGTSIALKPERVVVNLEALLELDAKKRKAYLKNTANCDIGTSKTTNKDLEEAKDAEQLLDVLHTSKRVFKNSNKEAVHPIPAGTLYLQPGEERRRSGSHYTPKSMTEPIVEKTLRPILAALGPSPTPEQILSLKICDPAMGSGAFLVETCRQLAQHLLDAWERRDMLRTASSTDLPAVQSAPPPEAQAVVIVPSDEDPLLHARRLVAQRCLYGVDRNPFAVNLAKLSLWLVTLAKAHSFAFLDHALKHGDSLVGLDVSQLTRFHWSPQKNAPLLAGLEEELQNVQEKRFGIHALGDEDETKKRRLWREAEDALLEPRLRGDLVIAAFFSEQKKKQRQEALEGFERLYRRWKNGDITYNECYDVVRQLRQEKKVTPFHWPLEFPEVFRTQGGFDAFVGNPPFAGKNNLINGNAEGYLDWLKTLHKKTHGNADLVAHFFRRTFDLLRKNGTAGLIATNTIAQGDTRTTGLRWICTHGGTIYDAERRYKWPNLAAVIVSIVLFRKGDIEEKYLDGRRVDEITAFLFHAGGHENPKTLEANAGKSYIGSYVLGMGFTFDDTDKKEVATPIEEMHRLIEENPHNQERIFPYIGGSEVNTSPTHAHHRYVINFGEMTEEEARQWPDLMDIVETKVKPDRMKLADNADGRRRKKHWWLWGRYTPALFHAIKDLDRVLVCPRVSQYASFAILPNKTVFSEQLVIFPVDVDHAFAVLQSRAHELWARFFSSSLGDGLRYTPSDCFETFPMPLDWENNKALEKAGEAYYTYRAELMVRHNEGMTQTYNRFHDPEELSEDIFHLRDLHDAMDRAVLDAYGWDDLQPECTFLLEYEEEDTKKKKPWRYRWPEAIHDEVLARLLDLNQTRALEEAPPTTKTSKKTTSTNSSTNKSKKKTKANHQQPTTELPLLASIKPPND